MTANLCDKSFLVVDDDEAMLRALDRVLKAEGATVAVATAAADAVEILTQRRRCIDLVITDLRMPLVTGMTLLYAIHKIFPRLPVIVLTALGSPDVKAECLREGAAEFLEKPLDASQLLEAIGRVLAGRRESVTENPGIS